MIRPSKVLGSTDALASVWGRCILTLLAFCATYYVDAIAQTISWGNAINDEVKKENGTSIDSTFVVQLGRFADGFDPVDHDPSVWAQNWRPFDEANTTNEGLNLAPPVPGAVFHSRSNVLNEDGTTGVEPFSDQGFDFRSESGSPEQAYMWVFNDQDGGANAEWALITDSTWLFPEDVDPTASVEWRTGETTTALFGNFTDGETFNRLQLESAAAIPEPSTALLGLFGAMWLLVGSRRR